MQIGVIHNMFDQKDFTEIKLNSALKKSLYFFVPVLIVITSVLFFDTKHKIGHQKENIQKSEQILIDLITNNTIEHISKPIIHINSIANSYLLKEYLSEKSEKNLKAIEYEILNYSNNIKTYDQIRILDLNGMELVRVNHNKGNPEIVKKEDLQNKSDRYYYTDAVGLLRNHIYVSKLDLNIENKKLEMPIKPMIRFVTPVFDRENQKKGYLFINFLAEVIFDSFHIAAKNNLGEIMLLNKNGYWLHGKDKSFEWGFMYKDKKDLVVKKYFPKFWEKAQLSQNTAIYTANGFFVCNKISIAEALSEIPDIDSTIINDSTWYIISHISQSKFSGTIDHIKQTAIIIFFIIALSLFVTSYFIARTEIYKRITQRNLLIAESEEEWRKTFDSVTDMIIIINPQKIILRANKAFMDYFADIYHENITCCELFSQSSLEPKLCSQCRIFSCGEEINNEVFDTKTGNWYQIAVSIMKDENGNIKHIIHSMRDITVSKNNEKVLEESEYLLNKSQAIAKIGNWRMNLKNHDIVWSDEIYRIFGVERDNFQPSYESFLNFIHPDDKKEVNKTVSNAIQNLESYNIEYNIIMENSTIKTVNEQAKISCENGNYFLDGTLQDITDRKKLEGELRQSEKMQAVGQLAGGVAHDFNNQLSAIVGYSEMLVEKLSDEKLKKFAKNIFISAQSAADLTRQLLAYSRKGKNRKVDMNIHSIIDEVITLLGRSIDKKIVIKKQLNASHPIITGDPSQIQNAILNIAINSRDAMSHGGNITFRTDNITLDESYCKIHPFEINPGQFLFLSISDNGSGIPKEIQKKIFEPFFTTKAEGKGTGMGLAAVYGTIKTHKGAINLYSEINRGTTFNIYIPLSTADTGTSNPIIEQGPVKGSGTIMIIDDEDIVRNMAGDILTDLGYTVLKYKNGNTALKDFMRNSNDIDLVIVDLFMPYLNGEEILHEIRKINPYVKVLLASGFSINEEIEALLKKGAQDFIQKPFMRVDISIKVADILNVKKN